ncbi:Orange carotenoid-binding protein [Halothece sp. PCC 7418]|uniref:orange carotenoid protein N-terminal domain-containing protein n=1 Tax=Halothece sp. (strain PCC 7418) TaxID=65093 RepID=UPI0002A05C90|nr:orange carotenoid protein N-terminal domain-containing protein [Halothece sp. PCC 7418]AFZ45309.1 Orange carotenoid-binding protein [Halothece sp. PCC 7418]
MVATSNQNLISTPVEAVDTAITQFQQLTTDDQLAALWFIYLQTGKAITPAAPGAARLQLAEGLLNQVKAMSHQEQLQFMRNLVEKVNTPETRAYGVLSANTKLAFWYRLAQWMEDGTVIPMPYGYRMSEKGTQTLAKIEWLEFNQQITILRRIVVDMGVDPLA